jgi:excinuclease ABC subunit A
LEKDNNPATPAASVLVPSPGAEAETHAGVSVAGLEDLRSEPSSVAAPTVPSPSGEPDAFPPQGGHGRLESIVVRGAKVHNLKNIDCEIPHNQMTVVTGVSGSGKSSLAFDTIYAEGQRRYVESLSAYARQFLERMERPNVEEVSGIAPAVAIRQKNTTRNPRSTVATATEIYDYLRLLFARVGVTTCHQCGEAVRKDSVDEIADRVLSLEPGRRFHVLFRLHHPTSSEHPAVESHGRGAANSTVAARSALPTSTRRTPGPSEPPSRDTMARSAAPPEDALKPRLFSLRQQGFTRLYQGGKVFEFSAPESLLEIDFSCAVYVLVDRLSIGPEIRQRLIDSVELCYREGGEAILEFVGAPSKITHPSHSEERSDEESAFAGKEKQIPRFARNDREGDLATGERPALPEPERLVFNERFECKRCQITYQEPEPRLFSFNNPFGACPRCQGFGNTIDFDLNLVIPDKNKTLAEGAVEPWTKPRYRTHYNEMKRLARLRGIPLDVPYHRLTPARQRWVIEGDDEFIGVRGFFEYLERKKYKLHVRVFLSRYRGYTLCSQCQGSRLRREALNVTVGGKTIAEAGRMSILEACRFFNQLRLSPSQQTVADKVLEEVRARLKYLYEVGLEYLTLDRHASTLSGGEAQRIQLATSLGSNLVGTLYVLDEPSIGLHARDTGRLIEILKSLRNLGNTILVVEHDAAVMGAADKILDLGPGAGEHGGHVVYSGDLAGMVADVHSLTGRYLSGELRIPVRRDRRKPGKQWLRLRGARQHNLKSIDVDIPLGLMVCISGVSGSGKSTLVHDVLYNFLISRRGLSAPRSEYESLEGDNVLADVVLVDQSPLGRTPRSNPITYIKSFDAVRELFAATPEARRRGYTPGHFSFNIPGGRCETCQGDGTVTVEMQFLADVELVCEECRGRRFKPSILEILYKGKNIYDVLQLTVREAMAFFSSAPKLVDKIRMLDEVGLGYLRLGQSATTLSGGEAQRVRLAAHLAQRAAENTLFIFDEPTTGLHFDDINKLLAAFRRLIDSGASVLIIEHNLDVLKTADWIIDLGPEGGDAGGFVVAAGPPEAILKTSVSHTARYLAPYLARRSR